MKMAQQKGLEELEDEREGEGDGEESEKKREKEENGRNASLSPPPIPLSREILLSVFMCVCNGWTVKWCPPSCGRSQPYEYIVARFLKVVANLHRPSEFLCIISYTQGRKLKRLQRKHRNNSDSRLQPKEGLRK